MAQQPPSAEEPEMAQKHPQVAPDMGLLEVLIVLAKHRRLVLGLPTLAVLIAVCVALLLPNVYTATARILPPQQTSPTASALLNQLAGIGGGSLGFGLKQPSDLYVGMLQSDTVADRLIDLFDLRTVFDEETVVDARHELRRVTTIQAGKNGIITISVEDEDPKRAAAIANAYVSELSRLNDSLAISESSQRRLFFEKQLVQTKDALALAEIELKKTQEKTGLIKLDDQGRAIIEAVAQLRAQVTAKQVQLEAMKSFATDKNPDFVRGEQELATLKRQLKRMEQDELAGGGDVFLPTGRVPEAGLEYIRRFRDMKYQETLFELVAKQYELARLDEAKEAALIQVIDVATAPDKKSKPKRTLIVLIVGVTALFLSTLIAVFVEGQREALKDPEYMARVRTLLAYLTLRRT